MTISDDFDTRTAETVWQAAVATVIEAGPLPDHIDRAPAHMLNWYRLMRRHNPQLRALTDADIAEILNKTDE